MCKISIIIPAYNRAHFVGQAVESALGQTFSDVEVIVVDDGSTDNTQEIIAGFADRRLLYIYQDNRGVASAFNRGLEVSRGEYVACLGSDDWYLPNGLAPLYEELERDSEPGVAAGGYLIVDQIGDRVQEVRPWLRRPHLDLRTWLISCPLLLQAALVRRSWIDKIGGFNERLKSVVDWDLGLRLAHAGCQMVWVERSISWYRLHDDNMVRKTGQRIDAMLSVLDSFFADPGLPPELVVGRSHVYAQAHLRAAGREFGEGHVDQAKRNVEKAIAQDPDLLLDGGMGVLDSLLGWADYPATADPVEHMNRVFRNLPEPLEPLCRLRRQRIASRFMGQFFTAYRDRNWAVVKNCGAQGILHDPRWLRNRGVVSILLQAYLGTRLAAPMKKLARRAHDEDHQESGS